MSSCLHLLELQERIECLVEATIRAHFPLDWKEDAITHHLLIKLRNDLPHITIYGIRRPIDVEWEIYKLHRTREASFGDLGLLVRYALPGGDFTEGAGFLEAKVRGRGTAKFQQVREDQVTRLLARSPETRLLLYDYNPVAVLDYDNQFPGSVWASWNLPLFQGSFGPSPVSSAPVLPLRLAAAIGQYNDTLYRFVHSFSHQLCQRYFTLHDLDFRDAAIRSVKGFPGELGSPNVVMVLRVAPEGQALPEVFRPSHDLYRPLE